MKIYLAGKIYLNDWRHSIVNGLGEVSVHPDEWPILKESIFATHDYVGPFFLSLGHGQSHYRSCSHATEVIGGHGCRNGIVKQCQKAIESCDLLFAYIQTRNCFGTFCEIGYATAHKKDVAICYAPLVDENNDMWFLTESSKWSWACENDPEQFLRKICPQTLPTSLEDTYAGFEAWAFQDKTTASTMQIDWRTMPDGSERRQAYYCSLEWEALRQGVISRAHGYCERCQSEPVYLVHHLTYARLYKENLSDLQGLCEKCHQQLHPSRVRSSC